MSSIRGGRSASRRRASPHQRAEAFDEPGAFGDVTARLRQPLVIRFALGQPTTVGGLGVVFFLAFEGGVGLGLEPGAGGGQQSE